ncbi:Caleosin-domain-containing protein [Hypoxylon fragiforme]|uniref:Caleosin-domain-containing protein n=1 Tax=Hypoxylon fragiforme TaxID=63214 RepID=UPI0020C73EED|nr:Caleosin-domain-containing protein [Hypoxylon fragiforme]KAI2610180.1 Caleosin-domain-containing protein [Hypoxylon fragiforme]
MADTTTTTTSPLLQHRRYDNGKTKGLSTLANSEDVNHQQPSKNPPAPTVLQQHVAFFDRDNDGVIWPGDVYRGFRDLGFRVLFSLGSLLIPIFFSYPTRLGCSWLPDPCLRIYVRDIYKAKHGSDSGVYDCDGHFRADQFDRLFGRVDTGGTGGLDVAELAAMWRKNRCAADPAGWSFAFMELWTTWLLLQKDGRVWKEDLRACYDGTLFWKISEERSKGGGWRKGYGISDLVYNLWNRGTWKSWESRVG